MYYDEDGRRRISVTDIIIKLLFLALFVFLLIWLLPKFIKFPDMKLTDEDLAPIVATIDAKTDPILNQIFGYNLNILKDTAKNYYTVQRLPQEVGEVYKLTLNQMLEKNLLLPLVDKYGNYCDVEKSYVTVEKLDNGEYRLKANLSCGDEEAYIIEYLGCHNLCNTCTLTEANVVSTESDSSGKSEVILPPTKPVTPDKPVVTTEYEYYRTLLRGYQEKTVPVYKYTYKKNVCVDVIEKVDVKYYFGIAYEHKETFQYQVQKVDTTVTYSTGTAYQHKKTITNTGEWSDWVTIGYVNRSDIRNSYIDGNDQYTYTGDKITGSSCGINAISTTVCYKYKVQRRTRVKDTTHYYIWTPNKTEAGWTATGAIDTTSSIKTTTTTTTTKWLIEGKESIPAGWTATGRREGLGSSMQIVESGWVKELDSKYMITDTKIVTESKTTQKCSDEYFESESNTETGKGTIIKTEFVRNDVIKGELTDWVISLPNGYIKADSKTDGPIWSISPDLDKIGQGWIATGNTRKR